jgi:two-component system, OmpR family, phosphate regulon sensor histidine kinase PhoR
MKKESVYPIVILTALSLIGLIGIQAYWINNSVEIKEQRFSQLVHESLSAVVDDLDRQETLLRINQSIESGNAPKELRVQESADTNTIANFNDKAIAANLTVKPDAINAQASVEKLKDLVLGSKNKNQEEVLRDKQKVVEEILSGLFEQSPLNIEERFSFFVLDSLLQIELKERGITAQYKFNVYNPLMHFVFPSEASDAEKLLNTEFRAVLFPNDFFSDSNYLMLYFPKQSGYLLQSMWLMLLISGVFMLVIIYGFYYTISTIVKQKKISEVKTDFINNMTHELKTPISTISLACEALNDPDMSQTPQRAGKFVEMIKIENLRLGKLVERVLQSAVIEKGELVLNKEQVDMHQVIEEVCSSVSLQINKSGGSLRTKLMALERSIEGDKMHLTNVFYNLLDNAIKYCRDIAEINISTENINNKLRIIVEDNGIGISKDKQKKIFDRLYRIPTGNLHDVKGFGLGLSYVKAVIDMQEGEIWVESDGSRGSKFILEFRGVK